MVAIFDDSSNGDAIVQKTVSADKPDAPDRKKFHKNTIMQYALQLAKYVFPFITIPYLTRVLGPDAYAVRAYLLAVMGFIMVLLDYGFTTYGTKVIADAKGDHSVENPFVASIMALRVGLSVIVIPLVVVLTFAIPIMAANPVYVAIAYFSVVMKAFLPDFLFQGREDTGIVTSRFVVTQIGSIILIFALVHSPQDLLVVPILEAVSALVALIWSWATAIRKCGVRYDRPSLALMKETSRQSTVFFISSAATTLINALCTFMIGICITDQAEIAYWSVAMTAVIAVQSLYTPLVMSLYPHMCAKRDFSLMNRLLKIGFPCAVIGSIAFGFLHEPIMWVLGGDEYMSGAYIMIWIAPYFVFSFLGQLFGYPVLAAVNRVADLTTSTVIAAVFNTVALLVLAFTGTFTLTTLCITRICTEAVLAITRIGFVLRWKRRNVQDLDPISSEE